MTIITTTPKNNNEKTDDNKIEQYPVVVDVDNSSSKKDEEAINADNDDSIELGATNIATTTTTIADNNDSNNDNDDDNYVELVSDEDGADDASNSNNKWKCTYSTIKKISIGLVLLGLIIYVIIDSLTTKNLQSIIIEFLNWVEQNPIYGVLAFVLVYVVCTIFFIPGSILTLGAGFVFTASTSSLWTGVLLGTIATFIGASIGAILSFLLGRYLFRESISTKLITKYPVFTAIDTALNEKGLRIMILLRLSPIIPFNVLNYVSGITGIKLFDYCIACIGMLPGTILYVFLGSSAGSLSEIGGNEEEEIDEIEENNDKTVTIIVIVVGIIFGILAVGVTSYYAKQELNKVIAQKEAEEAEEALEALEEEEALEAEALESQAEQQANEAMPEAVVIAMPEVAAAAVTTVRID